MQYYTSDATNDLLAGNSYVIFAEPILPGYASITEQINSIGFTNTNMLSDINVVTELPGDDIGGNVNHGPIGKPEISGNLQQDETLTVDVSNISDENGIDVGTYDFQWFANGSPINGAIYTSSTE